MLELALHLLETRRGLRKIHGLQPVPTLPALRLDPRTTQDGAETIGRAPTNRSTSDDHHGAEPMTTSKPKPKPNPDFDRELTYVFGFLMALLGVVLSFAFLPSPWNAIATMIIGASTGYLLATLVSYLRREETP
jgi:hypothetical protein